MPTAARILERAGRSGVAVALDAADRAGAYLELLARWNRTINLTGFALDPPSDEAIDRLIVEAFAAARYLDASPHRVIDVGSGGGSPALPLKMARADVEFTLIESKGRKAAFLREAIRALELNGMVVEQTRLEDLVPDAERAADAATIRAVRVDKVTRRLVSRLLRPQGRILVFSSEGSIPLVPERHSFLTVIAKELV